jgi:hypothetical protein
MKTGDILSLRPPLPSAEDPEITVILDEKKSGVFTLAHPHEPYQRIRVRDDGRVDHSDLVGKNSFFSLEEVSLGQVEIKSAVKSHQQGSLFYLFPQNGSLVTSTSPQLVCFKYLEQLAPLPLLIAERRETPPLAPWLKRRFVHEGFLHIAEGVSREKASRCQRLLLHHLGVPGSIVPGGAQEGLGKLAGSLSNASEVRELLLGERAMAIIGDLMGGSANVDGLTNLSAQVALRFPELPGTAPPVRWHTDGLRQGRTHGFRSSLPLPCPPLSCPLLIWLSLLVGVCLSDVLEGDAGNLLVWPGTHVPIHQ